MNLIVWHSQGFMQEPLNQRNWDKGNEISDRISHRNPDRTDRDYGLAQHKQAIFWIGRKHIAGDGIKGTS